MRYSKGKAITFDKFYKTVELLSNVKMIDRVRQAEVRSEGNGTPYELVESSTLPNSQKAIIKDELTYGHAERMALFMAYYERHQLAAVSEKVTFDYAIAGDYVDVGRYVTGEPECMVSFAEVRPTDFIDVLLNIDMLASASVEQNVAYYAAAVSVVDSLERSGYRVKLSGVMYSDRVSCDVMPYNPVRPVFNKPVIHEVRVSIKNYQEPINLAYLTSVCLGKTAFLDALISRPNLDTGLLWGCDNLPGFADRLMPDASTIYIPSLSGKARDGYSFGVHTPHYLTMKNLLADWKIDHLLAQ